MDEGGGGGRLWPDVKGEGAGVLYGARGEGERVWLGGDAGKEGGNARGGERVWVWAAADDVVEGGAVGDVAEELVDVGFVVEPGVVCLGKGGGRW